MRQPQIFLSQYNVWILFGMQNYLSVNGIKKAMFSQNENISIQLINSL